jgi:predicted glycoside hydrolase/deacetylase ChbG (UPF0249 family)
MICICVDDFGMHAGINEAALRLAGMNRVHAISCLVGGMSWTGRSRVLRRLDARDVDIGLHLDLTETPLLDGSRRPLRDLILDSVLRRLDRRIIRAEIRAQLDAFEQALGRAPAFVDGHQHVHQFRTVRTELIEELQARYRGSTPWIRSTRTPRAGCRSINMLGRDCLKPRGIEWLGSRGLASAAHRLGYPQNRHLLGVYDFEGGRSRYRELLARWLLAAVDGDLLMCHPSLLAHGNDSLIDARHAEFEVFSSASFDAGLRDADVQLRPMSQILARRMSMPQTSE